MSWHVSYSESAQADLRKLAPDTRNTIIKWVRKHLEGCEDPYATGKGLTANRSGQWRYRVGDYRILAVIDHGTITIHVVKIDHRSKVYH